MVGGVIAGKQDGAQIRLLGIAGRHFCRQIADLADELLQALA